MIKKIYDTAENVTGLELGLFKPIAVVVIGGYILTECIKIFMREEHKVTTPHSKIVDHSDSHDDREVEHDSLEEYPYDPYGNQKHRYYEEN